mgnify:CR=1 FL=1
MSVAFTREEDLEATAADLPDRPISSHPNLVTPAGLAAIDAALAEARAIEPTEPAGRVRFGGGATIERDDGRVETWRIVGEDEADPKAGSVSHVSPLARALIGREVGDEISINGRLAEITAVD